MKITEIFDSNPVVKVIQDDAEGYHVQLLVNGRTIDVVLDPSHPNRMGTKKWFVTFKETSKTGSTTFSPSGHGGELEVFSAVSDAIRHVIKKFDPEQIEFSGRVKTGQAKLYAKLARRFKGFDVKTHQGTFDHDFILTKIKEGLGDLAKATDEAPKAEQMFSHVVSMMKKFTGKGARVDAVDFKRPYIAFFVTMAEDFDHTRDKDRRKVFPTVAEVEAEMGPFFRKVIRLADSGNFEYSVYYAEPRPYGEDIDELKALFTHKYPDTII